MKKIFTIKNRYILKAVFTLFILVNASKSYGVIDTLKYYNVSEGLYYVSGYELQIERFQPVSPGFIQSIFLILGGDTGRVTIHIYGQEGGADAPYIEKDLVTPIVAVKDSSGKRTVSVPLTSPLYVANTQFFIAIGDISTGVDLYSDNVIKSATCSSTSGGDYYYDYYQAAVDSIGYDTYALTIGVVMDYDYSVSPSYYQDVTVQAGIATDISSRSIAWGDFNNDGYEDFIATGRLYKNNGNGTFTDITTSAGINMGAAMNAFVDMNNDGLLDILIVEDYNKNTIFINNGNETFTPHDLIGMPVDTTTTCFAIADFNNDKYPDLYLGQLWHAYPVAMPAYLFLNNDSLGFTNVTNLLYPANGDTMLRYACMFTDYDNDGKSDLYVANYYLERDELWHNNGNGTFTNVVADKGIDINNYGGSGHGTGVDWADYDNDGDMDLLLPMLAHPENMVLADDRSTTIYRNEGPPDYNFTDLIGQQVNNPGLTGEGIEYEETCAGGEWGDIDNDGLQDIFLTSWYGCRYVKLYMQKPDHTFELKTADFGLAGLVHASDAVFADYDNDGKIDIAAGDDSSHFRLFKNNGPFYNNFLEIDLKSTSQNDFAIGGRVVVYAGGNRFMRDVTAGQGEGMQTPYRVHFGLGQANAIDSVTVRWPNNTATETFKGLNVNGIYTLTEGGQVVQGINNLKNASSETLSVSPNPFSEQTILNYNIVNRSAVNLEIYSLLGQKVRTLIEANQPPGNYQIAWDAKDDSGKKLPSGFYMVSLKLPDSVITKKIVKVGE